MKTLNKPAHLLTVLAASMLLLAGAAAAETGERVSESKFYTGASRADRLAPKSTSRDERPALDTTSQRGAKSRSRDSGAVNGKSRTANASRTPNTDFWFYSADVELFRDNDRDGYYAGIDLLFDADTYFTVADVYAVVYLSFEGGDWNEYAVTDTFTIFGASAGDSYSIVTDLITGYPPGSYDILIELFDDFDDRFLAYIGPEDTSELSFLPLEDRDFDIAAPGGGSTVVVNRGGGGSVGLLTLLLLGAAGLARRYARIPS